MKGLVEKKEFASEKKTHDAALKSYSYNFDLYNLTLETDSELHVALMTSIQKNCIGLSDYLMFPLMRSV